MIHLFSSEALAALACLLFLAIAAVAQFFRWPFWSSMTTADTLLAIVSCAFACRGVASGRSCRWPSDMDFTSCVALVTGASSGVGYGVAQELSQHGWTVIMTGRNLMQLLKAKRSLMVQKPSGRLVVLGEVDLSDLDSVRSFAASVLEQKEKFPVSLLVNAAGVLRRHLHRCEDTGMEEMIATNVVGPMLLTNLLLPLLEEAAERSGVSSRIVNVASSCHTFLGVRQRGGPAEMLAALHPQPSEGATVAAKAGATAMKDFTLGNFVGYYGLSKLCVIWWTSVLARRVSRSFFRHGDGNQLKVFVACCHPGIITTHLYRDLFPQRVLDYIIYYPSLLIGKTWREGAQAVLRASIETDNMVHGGYYMCTGEYGPNSGINCLSKDAMNMDEAIKFCAWAEMQIEAQKNRPRQPGAGKKGATPKRIMGVKFVT
ncbi:putative short-chain dehydrogenase [Trypanosoma rangeli]|uniref:Putative short-chain dehydrogenase n=1 Tax=Trypanosoma rangeli TaxID=5698 RepID=A0A3R7N7S2_TRYRA|nr:putative short-chain dehydrogenase [Trypanosoma rangeli]RNF01713.1 putative short-chain dehydrogenase [Trypanosoma rangeli]|eukprot:RNF01713.1 putative short-chain dehydrogenase [Trypanosoma rangeli]